MAATRHSGAARLVHDAAMALPFFNKTAPASALAEELECMLDRGVPPLAIGQWVAVNQSALLDALRILAAAHRSCRSSS